MRLQQTSTKGLQEKAQLSGEHDLLGIVQKIKIQPYYQMVHVLTRICLRE